MASRLGALTLDLIARIGQFTEPLNQAERQAQESSSKISKSFDVMRESVNTYGMAVAGTVAGAVTALAGMAYSTAEQAIKLEQFSLRANSTTQDFQKMAVGAKAYGIEQDKLSDMMKDFNEKMGELTTVGGGGGKDFFEQIAVKTEGGAEGAKKLILQMQKLSGPEALQLYVSKLEEAGVTQQQMSFYLESMASDMTDLYPLLANGGEGMKLYADAAERAGLVMDANTIQSAKVLKEQVYLLDLQLQGAKNQLMQAVIPAFVDIADVFFSGSEQGLQFKDVADAVATSLRFVAKMAIGVVTNVQLAGKAMGAMAAVYSSVQNNKDWYEFGPLGYAKALFDARNEISQIGSGYLADVNKLALDAGEKMDRIDKGTASNTAKTLATVRQLGTSVNGVNSGLDDLASKQNKASSSATKHNKELEKQKKLLDGLGSGLVSNANLKGLNIKSAESISGGKVRGYTAEFAQLANTVLGDSVNRFTAFNDSYHKGTNSKHATGNAFDFTLKDAKQAQQTVAMLEDVAKRYGYSVKILDEYKDPSKRATGGHLHVSVLGKKASEAWKDIQDEVAMVAKGNELVAKQDSELAKQRLTVEKVYETEREKIIRENNESIQEINKAFVEGDPNRQKYLDLQKLIYQKDLEEFKKTQLKKQFEQINSLKSIQSQIEGLSGGADDIFAKATMSSKDYGNWSLKNNRDNSKKGLRDDLTSVEQNIMTSDVYQTDDDRYQALLDAHKEYREGMAALDVQYDQQVKDLIQSQHDMQLNIWQDLLSRTGTIFSQMAEMVKNTSGESSAAYKVMFLTNQGISIAQAMINTEVAATKAMAEGGMVAGIPMATAIRALGYASVGMIAAQTITGMAHNGIDNIPKEGTWLLDGGERVLNPQQNKDLTNYLSNKGSSGGNVEVNVQVTDSGVTSQSNQADQKQLGQMIGNAVRAVIMQEKRQGGLLY